MEARPRGLLGRPGAPAVAAVAATASVACALGSVALWWWLDPRTGLRAPLPADLVLGTVWPVAGALVVRAAPRNPVGWVLTCASLIGPYYLAAYYAAADRQPGVELPAADAAAWLGSWGFVPYFFVLPLLLLLFPDGRPLTPRWRPVIVAVVLVAAVTTVARMLAPGTVDQATYVDNPLGIGPGWLRYVTLVGSVLCIFAGNALGVVSLVLRTRRAVGVHRTQLQWLLLGGIVLVLGFALPFPSGVARETSLTFGVLGPPVTIVIAIWRHRLFDIEFALNRTIVLLVLSGLLMAAYAGTVLLLQRLGLDSGPGLVAVALAALGAASLRSVVQRTVDRWLFGHRGDPYAVVARVGRHIAPASEPVEALGLLVEALQRALRLPYVAFADTDGRVLASAGEPVAGTASFPAEALGRRVGALVVGLRRGGERLGSEELEAVAEVSGRAGTLAYAGLLVADVADSRARIVAAREEERRRLRDDLHDELGPTLAGTAHQLDSLARRLREAGDELGADRALGLRDRMRATVGEVRDIVHGLRPPVLDQRGLSGALQGLVEGIDQPRCRTHVDLPPTLPAAVEVTAYAVAAEAVANSLRHSAGSRLDLSARVREGVLLLEVVDNGQGVRGSGGGLGLRSMGERAAELGGRLEVGGAPGGGTRIRAWLPVQDREPHDQ